MIDFTLPELGENITAGDVLRVLVKPGDTIEKDQPVLELETDKATIEVPSSVAGQVKDIKVKAGDKVAVGQSILTVEDGASSAKAPAPAAAGKPAAPRAEPEPAPSRAATAALDAVPEEGAVAQRSEGKRSRGKDKAGVVDDAAKDRQAQAPAAPGADDDEAEAPRRTAAPEKVVDFTRASRSAQEAPSASELPPAPAAPSVRRIARELGVDINQVPGSGNAGRISEEDVKTHVGRIVANAGAPGAAPAEPLPDFSRWGDIERQPMKGVRRKTAQHLASAWASIPHVTQYDQADVTALEEVRKRFAPQVERAGGSLTVTAILVKVVASALKVFPQFNASVDMRAEEIILKKFVNIGIAVDTDRGLLVPVIRDADTKNITTIAAELAQLSEKARSRKLSLEEMQGGCFSISNLGGIGGTAFTPIVNLPEVGILGVSRARMAPVWVAGSGDREGHFAPRLMLPLSLSYDHRVVDGADGIRFLRWIVDALEQPFVLALQG